MIKNRYNQLRFYTSWNYPLFYDRLCAAKFPLQLLGLCLATALAVSFYNVHYSFAATMENSRAKTKAAEMLAVADTQNPKVTTQSRRSNGSVSGLVTDQSTGQLEATLIESEEVLQQQVAKAEALLKEKKQQTKRLEQKVESAKNLLRTSDQDTPDSSPDLQLYNADWLQELPANHYVVQVAAATEPQELVAYATDRSFSPPLAIYPFKVNRNGEVVYGLSTGLFIVEDDALTELPVLSKISEQHGVWVRKVADIKDQLTSLKDDRIVQ